MRDGSNDVPNDVLNDPDQHGSPPGTFPFSAVAVS